MSFFTKSKWIGSFALLILVTIGSLSAEAAQNCVQIRNDCYLKADIDCQDHCSVPRKGVNENCYRKCMANGALNQEGDPIGNTMLCVDEWLKCKNPPPKPFIEVPPTVRTRPDLPPPSFVDSNGLPLESTGAH